MKARFTDSQAFFIIHAEHQSTAPVSFASRYFRYRLAIFSKLGLPVYPMVLDSHDRPKKKQPTNNGRLAG